MNETRGEAEGGARGITIRTATGTDMAAVARIINHYIETTAINFRTAPQTADDWIAEWGGSRGRYPWLVAAEHQSDTVLGLAYGGAWSTRNAYDWCVHVTVYVEREARGRGIGRALYGSLLPLLDRLGFHTQLAMIALPNPASVALHERFGFRSTGLLREVGYKLGAWHDVGLWQRMVTLTSGPPEPPAPPPAAL